MSRYRRAHGSTFFFTVVLADRSSTLLVEQVDRLRRIYRTVFERQPFETVAICILPDHPHAIWTLPEGDVDFPSRWNLIKGGFSRGLQAGPPSMSKLKNARKAFGSAAIGSTPFATMLIWSGTLTTYTSIL